MNIRYRVDLSEAERLELEALLSGGKHAARKLKRAQILLAADAGVSDETIASTVRVSGSTVYRTKRRFVEGNLELALSRGAATRSDAQTVGQGDGACWWRPPAPIRRGGASAGRWNCWPMRWSS